MSKLNLVTLQTYLRAIFHNNLSISLQFLAFSTSLNSTWKSNPGTYIYISVLCRDCSL